MHHFSGSSAVWELGQAGTSSIKHGGIWSSRRGKHESSQIPSLFLSHSSDNLLPMALKPVKLLKHSPFCPVRETTHSVALNVRKALGSFFSRFRNMCLYLPNEHRGVLLRRMELRAPPGTAGG